MRHRGLFLHYCTTTHARGLPPPPPPPPGTAFYEQLALAKAAKQAIDINALRSTFISRLSIFWPVIVG